MEALTFLVANFWPIAGAVAAACLAAYLAGRNARTQRRAAACSIFRSRVLTELGAIYPTPANWPSNIDAYLRVAFPNLQAAVNEFRPFVPWWRRRAFDRAWFVYRLGEDGREIDKQVYHQYMGFSSPDRPTQGPKETFRANVSKLLEFAKQT